MNNEKDKLESSSMEEAVEIVAIALDLVPYIGGVMSSTATYFLEKRKSRRLNQFLYDLANDLKEVQDAINQDFVTEEEFQDLVEDVFSQAAETRQKEKLEAIRNVFVNMVLADKPNYDEALEILELINRWQPRHLIILNILADPLAADNSMNNVVGQGGGLTTSIMSILSKLLPDWDDDQIDRTWNELYDQRIHSTSGTRTMMTDRGIHQLEGRLSPFGQKVISYILRKDAT